MIQVELNNKGHRGSGYVVGNNSEINGFGLESTHQPQFLHLIFTHSHWVALEGVDQPRFHNLFIPQSHCESVRL